MDECGTLGSVFEPHFAHGIGNTARRRAMCFEPGTIRFLQFENVNIPRKASLHRTQPNRDCSSIFFHRLDHFDLFHTWRTLTDLFRVGHEIPNLFSRRLNHHITFKLHFVFLVLRVSGFLIEAL
jgi:hypothetical protein